MDYGDNETEQLYLAVEEVRLAVGAGEAVARASSLDIRLAASWLYKAQKDVRAEDPGKGIERVVYHCFPRSLIHTLWSSGWYHS